MLKGILYTQFGMIGGSPADNAALVDYIAAHGGGVQTVTGLNTDNTDPANPIINISVDGTTITGDGTPGSPLTANSTGGSPGGTDTAIQVNVMGAFGGDATNFNYGVGGSKFQGVQVPNPEAPGHFAGVYGATVPAPATLTATLVLDPLIPPPSSYTVAQVDSPVLPTTPSVSLIEIAPVTAGSTSYNSMGSYTASGQTINYNAYAYRSIGGTRVINPLPWSFSYTDMLNDGSNFSVDISSLSSSAFDGFILVNTSFGWSVDLGPGVTSFNDNGTNSGTAAYESSNYAESGFTWSANVAQYKNINAQPYRSAYQPGSAVDSNNAGYYLILSVSGWAAAVNDGFIAQYNSGLHFDLGTATNYFDWGQSAGSISDFATFASIAFPYIDPASLVGATADTAGFVLGDNTNGILASGADWVVYNWAYKVIGGIKYFVSSPDVYDLGVDPNDGQYYYVSGSFSPGAADGYVMLLYIGGTLVGGVDYGNTSSYVGLATQTAPAVTPAISSYTGMTRAFSAYGKVTSPSTKYSVAHNDQSFTDNNPVDGYLISHTLATFGTATNMKLIQESPGAAGNFYEGVVTTSTIIQTNTGLGNATVTPNQVGFLANGSNLNITYTAYADKTINGTLVYSLASPSAAVVDPNDSAYYTVSLVAGTVSGAAYKFHRTGDQTGYQIESGASFTDTTVLTWPDSSTVTPDSAPVTAIIGERAQTGLTDIGIAVFRNTTANSAQATVDFMAKNGGPNYAVLARAGADGGGNFTAQSVNGGLYIGTLGSTQSDQINVNNQTIFNVRQNASYSLGLRGSSVSYLMYASANTDSILFGTTGFSFGSTGTMVSMYGKNNGALALVPGSGGVNAILVRVVDGSSGTTLGGLSNGGYGFFGRSTVGEAYVSVGAGNASYGQVDLAIQSTAPTISNTRGIIWFDGTNLRIRINGTNYTIVKV